jgi:hypothetical protein
MQLWAHVTDGVVDYVTELDDDHVPGENVIAVAYAKDMVRAPDGTIVGQTFDGTVFGAAPQAAAPIASVDAVYALIQLSRTPTKDGKSDLLTATRALVGQAGAEVQVWFERAQRWVRTDRYVTQVASGLGLSDSDVDALFIAASKIPFEKAAT